jgi:hypothetical protein
MPNRQFPLSLRELRDDLNKLSELELEGNVSIFNSNDDTLRVATKFGKVEDIDRNGDLSGALDDGNYLIKI